MRERELVRLISGKDGSNGGTCVLNVIEGMEFLLFGCNIMLVHTLFLASNKATRKLN